MDTLVPPHSVRSASETLILQAALALVVDRGYEGATMAAVAKRSGLPVGSLYWHFSSKEELFAALVEYCFALWESRHTGDQTELLAESVAGSAARSRSAEPTEEAFWATGLLLALERRLEGNAARQKYLEVRGKMFARMIAVVRETLPPEAVRLDPELPKRVVTLGRIITDGGYIAAAAGDDVNFEEIAAIGASLTETLVEQVFQKHSQTPDGEHT